MRLFPPFKHWAIAYLKQRMAEGAKIEIPEESRELWRAAAASERGSRKIAEYGLAHISKRIEEGR